MKGWNILEREDSTVELQSIKGEELTDVLEEFAVTHQIDPLPVINKSTVILKVGVFLCSTYLFLYHFGISRGKIEVLCALTVA